MLLCHTLSDSQPAAVSIEDGPSEDRRHVADEQTDSYTWPELKFTLTYWQVVDLQTVEYRKKQGLSVSSVSVRVCEFVFVCVLLLIEAIFDCADKGQGLLPFHTRVSGMLKCCLDHFCRFLVHCQRNAKTSAQGKMQSVSALMWQRQRVRVYRSRRMKSGCHRKRWKCQISHITKLEENCI